MFRLLFRSWLLTYFWPTLRISRKPTFDLLLSDFDFSAVLGPLQGNQPHNSKIEMFASSQVSSTPEQPPYNINGDLDLILSRFRSDFEPLLIQFASKLARKRLKIKSGSGLVRKGGCFKLGLNLAGLNISILRRVLGKGSQKDSGEGFSEGLREGGFFYGLCSNKGFWEGFSQTGGVLFRKRELTEFYAKLGEFCEEFGEFALAHKSYALSWETGRILFREYCSREERTHWASLSFGANSVGSLTNSVSLLFHTNSRWEELTELSPRNSVRAKNWLSLVFETVLSETRVRAVSHH